MLLLLSLAASFAFGLMLGKGQADERLVVRKETPIVSEAALIPKKNAGEIVELGVADDDFAQPETNTQATTATTTETPATTTTVTPVIEEEAPAATTTAPQQPPTTTIAAPVPVPYIAQLISTGDQKIAEALAVRVINRGYNAAYVERGSSDKGPIYRVRVRFESEAEARAAEPKLREFSKDVWITAK